MLCLDQLSVVVLGLETNQGLVLRESFVRITIKDLWFGAKGLYFFD